MSRISKLISQIPENIRFKISNYLDARHPEMCWALLVHWSLGYYTINEAFAEGGVYNQSCRGKNPWEAYCLKCATTGRLYRDQLSVAEFLKKLNLPTEVIMVKENAEQNPIIDHNIEARAYIHMAKYAFREMQADLNAVRYMQTDITDTLDELDEALVKMAAKEPELETFPGRMRTDGR
jgi:hypothetical protein